MCAQGAVSAALGFIVAGCLPTWNHHSRVLCHTWWEAWGNISDNEKNMRTLPRGVCDEIRQFVAGNPGLFPRAHIVPL